MRKIIYSVAIAMLCMFGFSCTKRTVIPDDELALIFRDAFLVNAYVFDKKIEFDTLRVYEPIFDRYGYSTEDVAYTVGSFSKRKSARLSDVVEEAIKLLTEKQLYYKAESVILDSIDIKAQRFATRTLYYAEQHDYHSVADTVNLFISLYDVAPGEYRYSFDYMIDSLDNNSSNYRSFAWVESEQEPRKRKKVMNTILRRNIEGNVDKVMKIDTLTYKLALKLAESFELKRDHHVTFKNVEIQHTPPADVAVEALFKDVLDIRIFADENFVQLPAEQPEPELESEPEVDLEQADSLQLPII